jgi:hypothetical protein
VRGDHTEYVNLGYVTVERVTPKALLIYSVDVDETWVPMSLVDWEESTVSPEEGSTGDLYVARWFAEKEGLL